MVLVFFLDASRLAAVLETRLRQAQAEPLAHRRQGRTFSVPHGHRWGTGFVLGIQRGEFKANKPAISGETRSS
jgi:hypothetical protein